MISETDALERILLELEPRPAITLLVAQAAGHFAAGPILSPSALPRFDQSAMDGYAIRAVDAPGIFRLIGEQPAGTAREIRVGEGETVRIFTGAPLPPGADAVVMQEDITVDGPKIRIPEKSGRGEFVRRRGEDVCEGQQLVAPGDRITASHIGLLCAAGITHVSVHRRARIAIITTGDELRPPGSPLAPGELYESNGPMLAAQLAPEAEIIGMAHVGDDPAEVANIIRTFAGADAIVLSAGVSVGDHDPVRFALRDLGATLDFWRVAVKPGKPFLFARLGTQRIFGLPGNPVSTFVTAHLFVRPALARMAGSAQPSPMRLRIPLGVPLENSDPNRVLYVRAILRDGLAFPAPLQQSHGLASLAVSDLLVRLEPQANFAQGETIDALPMKFH